MFELNPNARVTTEPLEDTTIWYIDDFYKNPDKIVDHLLEITPSYFKQNEGSGYNGTLFQDMRHIIEIDITHVYQFLSDLCGDPVGNNMVTTNCFRFLPCDFNNYSDNYWWPHYDIGHTGIVYFNDDEECGTNVYKCLVSTEDRVRYNISEHLEPWRPKENYELLKSIKPRYNRCILFDAKRYLHGQNIIDDRYTDQFRLNQVLFLNPNGL